MKLSPFWISLFLLLSGAALAQEGVATYNHTFPVFPGTTGDSRVFFSPKAMRIEVQMIVASAPAPFKTTMIQRASEPDKFYTINDTSRTAIMSDLVATRDPRYTVKRQGSDRVAGVACDKAVATAAPPRKNWIEVCISNEFVASPSWLAAMNRGVRTDDWMKAVRDAGLTGFPVRVQYYPNEKGGPEMTMELVRLERKRVPSSLFEIPAGYKETR
jgi:hypothetical protein